MTDALADVRFDALRNALYHSARRRFLDTQNRVLSLVIVAAGTAAVGDLGKDLGISATILAGVAALAGTLQLVFDLGGRARTHEFLQRRFYELVAEISETRDADAASTAKFAAALSRLYAEEPPPMRALDAISYNAAVESLGKTTRVHVNAWQSLWRQWWPFYGSKFPWEPPKPTKSA